MWNTKTHFKGIFVRIFRGIVINLTSFSLKTETVIFEEFK